MTVEITSPVLGKLVGETYTGTMEAWLLAEGYASQDGYTGPGVANTGAMTTTVANDPTRAANREAPNFPLTPASNVTIANDVDNLNELTFPAPGFDLDVNSVDTESPSDLVFEPTTLVLAGGKVEVYGDNLEGVTSVTVGGTAATSLIVTEAEDGIITFVAPAKAAGAHTVVLVDASGNSTSVGALTYAA